MAEDLRTHKNPKTGTGMPFDGSSYVLHLTKSALNNHKDLPEIFQHERVEVEKGWVEITDENTILCEVGKDVEYRFNTYDVVKIEEGYGEHLHDWWINFSYVCPVCGVFKPESNHGRSHIIRVTSGWGDPIGIVINLENLLDEGDIKAQRLAQARAELRKYFPGKRFEILPSLTIMMKDYRASSAIIGVAHVATYIAIEV